MSKVVSMVKSKVGLFLAVVLAAGISGLTTSFVDASIPDSSGQINACYNNRTKALKVTDPAGNCTGAQTPLSWDQNGGTVVGNQAVASFGDISADSPETFLTIPNLGILTIACTEDGTNYVNYDNTTGNSILVASGALGGGELYLAPGDTSGVGNSDFIASATAGSSTYVGHISIVSNAVGGDDNHCYFQAQATVNVE